jgi:hypothetical protein
MVIVDVLVASKVAVTMVVGALRVVVFPMVEMLVCVT